MIVTTTTGDVRGHAGVFLDIPYAAAPIGAGRFAPPAPHEPWAGVREATRP
ncbi:carboxylesterase family protein, partial [Amycolatopsis sp. NPDC049252]|uniref:carboxylesterase family protein n=1 Tax=Amycolatopsis sp. NPDC049252 TaxID=3363933 RepID=UPI0037114873